MANRAGLTYSTVKYGYVYGPRSMVEVPLAASQTFTDNGGKFVEVKNGTAGYATIVGDGGNYIDGWAETGAYTSDATAGQDWVNMDTSCNSVYYMPANTTVTQSMVGTLCDITVTSNVQSAAVDASTDDLLYIVDVDITNQAVYVKINPEAQASGS